MNGRGASRRAVLLAAGAVIGLPGAVSAALPYNSIQWVKPQSQQTVHDNRGNVLVELALTPPLQLRAGHRLQLVVDGQALPDLWSSQSGLLSGLVRGQHRLQAYVVARDGRRLAASEPLVFYLWQASHLLPQTRAR